MHRGDDGKECIVLNTDTSFDMSEFKEMLKHQPITERVPSDIVLDLVPVVRCKDCVNCFELADTDPLTPYEHREGVPGFFCVAFDMDFYMPAYNAATFYCADGKRRTADDKSD